MKKNTEIEIKLVVDEENLERFFQLKLVKNCLVSGSRKVRQLSSSYFDTADMVFNKHGIAYRVRDKGDGSFEATVKTSKKSVGGFTERVEINLPLKTAEPELTGFTEQGLEYDLAELAADGISCLFTVKVERITYLISYEGASFELAIDKGYIVAAANEKLKSAIDEIELELVEGEAEQLIEFVEKVRQAISVREEGQSKYARGLALCKLA